MEVEIYSLPNKAVIEMVFYRSQENGKIAVYNPINQKIKQTEPYTEIPEEFILKFPFYDGDILSKIKEAIEKTGAKNTTKELLEGELKATKYHLEDLRIITKLKDKPVSDV